MIRSTLAAGMALALSAPALAQPEAPPARLSPAEIVAQADTSEWIAIAARDLLVMDLAPDAQDNSRRVVIQLIPAPFSQGWVANIRLLARSGWYDGISVNRVQDNYVVQWGDATERKPLPVGLRQMTEAEYVMRAPDPAVIGLHERSDMAAASPVIVRQDPYAPAATFEDGWPVGNKQDAAWPVHCYGMVGVGRGLSPDTGTGAELYTVIGHAPRHLDRNIALVGRVIEGVEHLSSLPRGKGELGFYAESEAGKRTPIQRVRIAADLPPAEQPTFEYLSTESESFASYAEARSNRIDAFFITPAGGADICNIPVPVRRRPAQ